MARRTPWLVARRSALQHHREQPAADASRIQSSGFRQPDSREQHFPRTIWPGAHRSAVSNARCESSNDIPATATIVIQQPLQNFPDQIRCFRGRLHDDHWHPEHHARSNTDDFIMVQIPAKIFTQWFRREGRHSSGLRRSSPEEMVQRKCISMRDALFVCMHRASAVLAPFAYAAENTLSSEALTASSPSGSTFQDQSIVA